MWRSLLTDLESVLKGAKAADLIRDEAGQAEWAERLALVMDGLLEDAGL